MFGFSIFFFLVCLIAFILGIVFLLNKSKRKIGFFLLIGSGISFALSFALFIAFLAFQTEDQDKVTTQMDHTAVGKINKEVEPEETATYKEHMINSDQKKTEKFIKDDFDPLVRSVNANIDTNWQFYMIQPIERLELKGNLDSFKFDVVILVDIYKAVIIQIDGLDLPNYLNKDLANDVEIVKTNLIEAINKRIDTAETLLSATTKETILNTDMENIIEDSNVHLQVAAKAYGKLMDNI